MQVGEERSSNEAGKQSEFGYIKVKYAHNVFLSPWWRLVQDEIRFP